MKARIAHFRQGRHRTSHNQMIVVSEQVTDRDSAEKMVGKKVTYNTGKKAISGEVRSAHGNKGALRVLFVQGMPGQALGKQVEIQA